MTADDLTDRPDDTTPFIGKPRRQLINSTAFQTACANARFAGKRSPEIMRMLRCTDAEQYIAWYIWLGRHPEQYHMALQRHLGASALAYVARYAPTCLPMLHQWRASTAPTQRTMLRTRKRRVPEEIRAAIIDGLDRGMSEAAVRDAVGCRRNLVKQIAHIWRASHVVPMIDQSTPEPDAASAASMGSALVRQRVDGVGERYTAMLRSVLTLTDDYTASVRRDVAALCAMPMTRDSVNALARALPEFDRYEELAVSLAAALRRAIDEHVSGNGGTA